MNIKIVVVDGNVDVAKQNNDVRDLLARGVDAVLMSPVESGALVPAARAVMSARPPALLVMDRDVPSDKTLCLSGQSNVTMAEERRRKNGRRTWGNAAARATLSSSPASRARPRRSIATKA